MKCKIDGCEKDAKATGLCYAHYNRQRRTGTTELKERKPKPYKEELPTPDEVTAQWKRRLRPHG